MLDVFSIENYRPGHRSFSSEAFLDFELNRWLPYMDEAEVRAAARRLGGLEAWKTEMTRLGEQAEQQGRSLHASTYYRAAEFYMTGRSATRAALIERYLRLFDLATAGWGVEKADVPFDGGALPTLILRARGERRDTLVIHGGFDSYKEEFFMAAPRYAAAGFDVVVFDGPGQGQAIRQYGLTMDAAWERPVAAVLDHLEIESCTLMGFSLGGYLAPRAAAFEPRVRRVIANDQMFDFFGSFTARAGPELAAQIETLVEQGARDQVNAIVEAIAGRSETSGWAAEHGREISGAADGFEFLQWLRGMRTGPFSHLIQQDFLLLGAQEDHIVPISQFYQQAEALTHVRSLTAQLFTRADHAHTHCHVANTPLIIAFVLSWLDFQLRAEADRRLLPPLA